MFLIVILICYMLVFYCKIKIGKQKILTKIGIFIRQGRFFLIIIVLKYLKYS